MSRYATNLSPKQNKWHWLPYALALLSISPSLIWISLDRRVWQVDQAWYGQLSVELYYTLVNQPANWLAEMMAAFGTKAPLIAWLGQFFVPAGLAGGAIDSGLLLSVLVVQVASLVLMFRTLQNLSPDRSLIPVTAVMSMAAAPLFVGMSHQYFVEPLQLLTVAWFVLIMSCAPRWDRAFIVAQLAAATAVAMLAKSSSPLYCVGPGLVALKYVFWPGSEQAAIHWRRPRTILTASAAIVLSLAAGVWYTQNLETVVGHVSRSSSGPVAELFGKSDTFANTLIFWLDASQRSFYLPVVLLVVALVLAGGAYYFFAGQQPKFSHTSLAAAVALAEIGLVLAAFSSSPNRETRYLLPLLPYFSLLLGWALLQIDQRLVTVVVIIAFSGQWLASYGQTFGVTRPNSQLSPWLQPVSPDSTDAVVLNAIVARTCADERYTVVGVNLDWLNDHSAAYYAAKQRLQNGIKCYYSSVGFAQSDIKKAEEFVRAVNPLHIVTVDPQLHPIPAGPFNQVAEAVLEKVFASDEVYLAPPLPEDPGVLIFNRTKDKPPENKKLTD